MSHDVVDDIPMDPGQRRITGEVADLVEKPEMPGETAESVAARQKQAEILASLNDEQNRKLKRLFSAAQGLRAFRGSVMGRATPGNRAGAPPRSLFDIGGRGGGGGRDAIADPGGAFNTNFNVGR